MITHHSVSRTEHKAARRDQKEWQLLPRETCADVKVERYPHIPRFLEGEDETKGVPWLRAIA